MRHTDAEDACPMAVDMAAEVVTRIMRNTRVTVVTIKAPLKDGHDHINRFVYERSPAKIADFF